MKTRHLFLLSLLAIAMATLAPATAAKNEPPPAYYSIYWPWEQCSAENPFCAALERIDVKTGRGSFTSPVLNDYTPGSDMFGWTPFGVTFDVDGTMYTVNNWTDLSSHGHSRLARVNMITGELTYIGPAHDLNFAGPEMDSCGNLYATGFTVGDPADPLNTPLVFGDSYLYRFDKYTGDKTRLGDTGRTDWMDLAFDSQGRLWATTDNKLYRLDPQTGASTFVADIIGVPTANIPAARPTGRTWRSCRSPSTRTTSCGQPRCGDSAFALTSTRRSLGSTSRRASRPSSATPTRSTTTAGTSCRRR